MSFKDAKASMDEYRKRQVAASLGEVGGTWFTSKWNSVADMLKVFSTDEENKAIASKYFGGNILSKAVGHMRLDYVCALRREIRKQYVSGEDGICTDVTPFRHGVMSAHGAYIFDGILSALIDHVDRQAETGGGT